MSERSTERKLAAIMMTDVVGYSRLIAQDEAGTLRAMGEVRKQIIDPAVAVHQGRIVKTIGDGLLIDFPSVVNAVICATHIQRWLIAFNAGTADESAINLRIGINLGDVVVEDGDIFGDGVNVAARLEGLCEPGGVCLSGAVWDQVRDKLDVPLIDLGEQSLRNIARRVHVFGIPPDAISRLRDNRPMAQAAASPEGLTKSGGAIPHAPRLSLVVLPFANLSGDLDQAYFADGMTEVVTTDLSRIGKAFVIASATAATYKDRLVDAKQVSRELGVRYVLRGSLQKSGQRIRLNVQLVEGESGIQLWSERFDGDTADPFGLQDQVTARIANAIGREIPDAALRETDTRRTAPDAAELLLRGIAASNKPQSRENLRHQEDLFRQVLELDPDNSEALARLGRAILLQEIPLQGFTSQTDEGRAREGIEAAEKAVALDSGNARAHLAMGIVFLLRGDPNGMALACHRAIACDRNLALAHGNLAAATVWLGRPDEGLRHIEQTMRLDPQSSQLAVMLSIKGRACFLLKEALAAAECFEQGQIANPNLPTNHAGLAMAHAMLGHLSAAKIAAGKLLRFVPDFRLSRSSFAPLMLSPPAYHDLYEEIVLPAAQQAGLPP